MNTKLFEPAYVKLVEEVLETGHLRPSRAGNTLSTFSKSLTFDAVTYPVIMGRKMNYAGVEAEFKVFITAGENPITNVSQFQDAGCNYWNGFAGPDGELTLDYGNKWFNWDGVNQVSEVIDSLTEDPYGRRHIISGWDPRSNPTLKCCHLYYQFYVNGDNKLNLFWLQRSADLMLGVPSDAVLALELLQYICAHTGYAPGEVKMEFVDCHIYEDHLEPAREYLDSFYWLDEQVKETKHLAVLGPFPTGSNFIKFPLSIGKLK